MEVVTQRREQNARSKIILGMYDTMITDNRGCTTQEQDSEALFKYMSVPTVILVEAVSTALNRDNEESIREGKGRMDAWSCTGCTVTQKGRDTRSSRAVAVHPCCLALNGSM
jgi:hypothetical protein